jgi:hypothetical protein
MARSLARAERLRQLAAAGLIWEHLRVQARPALAPAPTSAEGAEPPELERPLPAMAQPALVPPAAVQPAVAPSATTQPPEAAGEPVADASFGSRDRPPGDVPVLWDAVDTEALPGPPGSTLEPGDPRPAGPHATGLGAAGNAKPVRAAPRPGVPPGSLRTEHDATPARRDGSARPPKPGVPSAALAAPRKGEPRDDAVPAVRKMGARPRLLRMKEKGLFQNGPET